MGDDVVGEVALHSRPRDIVSGLLELPQTLGDPEPVAGVNPVLAHVALEVVVVDHILPRLERERRDELRPNILLMLGPDLALESSVLVGLVG